ncbi:hypothetical protein KHS38_03830 [Mucilaginibacter sp. Bleaf8]|uniref:YciI family protein n=1 Tax=Mucilaginibacter sp. Bleaf8 TaxID=2834430 RepID=UPI001BD0BDF0|nr:YciI family protein [Mucilaginibacter sp. Bleaf8]MBS7563526.1 hypothetical protein [Mucilaginibacter sp. Bleaf8]
MKQYLVTAYDYKDEGALQRRLDVRPHHLDNIKKLQSGNNFVVGGAILNEQGQMIGSSMIVQFETDEEMESWKNNDPYVLQKVWETVDVKPFKQAIV